MTQEKYFPLTDYESNIKKINDLWKDFSRERASNFYDLMIEQDKKEF